MSLDLTTVSTMTSVVVIVAGVVFILETLLREDDSVGRTWSLGFLGGMISSVAYTFWAMDPSTWWAVAVGNAAFVASAGFMWLGCRLFNERSLRWQAVLVAVLVVGAAVAVAVEGESGGPWAGAWIMFLALAILPAAAAVECATGRLGRNRVTLALLVVFAVEALYYAGRAVVFLVEGEGGPFFLTWWGTAPTSVLTVVLTVVAVVIASVLRAERAGIRGRTSRPAGGVSEGVLGAALFRRLLDDALRRARGRDESIAVISIRIHGLDEIATAFGMSEASDLREAARVGVRSRAPLQAWVGEDGEDALFVAVVVDSEAAAREAAAQLRDALRAALQAADTSIAPGFGVGVAFAAQSEISASALLERAGAVAAEQE